MDNTACIITVYLDNGHSYEFPVDDRAIARAVIQDIASKGYSRITQGKIEYFPPYRITSITAVGKHIRQKRVDRERRPSRWNLIAFIVLVLGMTWIYSAQLSSYMTLIW